MDQSEGQISYWREDNDVNMGSPGMLYEEKFECFWIVNGDEDKIIEFQILEMDIEKSSNCQNASLHVRLTFTINRTNFGVERERQTDRQTQCVGGWQGVRVREREYWRWISKISKH